MLLKIIVLIASVLVLDYSFLAVELPDEQARDTKAEAKQLWELAIAAKGGRQKLEQINSLAVFHEYSKGRASTEVYSFPDRRWEWFDTGPSSKFPLLVYAMDFEKKVHCFIQGTGEGCEPIGGYSKRHFLEDPQLLYLLETKWVKPELLAASKDTLGLHSVDIVKVRLEQFEISVYLDAKTHLPLRIAYHSNVGGPYLKVGDIFEWYGLSDYHVVNEIMLPHRITHTHSPTRQLRYEINPAFDPGVFARKPDRSAGLEQWRAKGGPVAKNAGDTKPSTKVISSAEIQTAIQQLEHQDENVQLEAWDKLTQAGKSALPALTVALAKKQALTKFRFARLILAIDQDNEAATDAFNQLTQDLREDEMLRRTVALQLIRNDRGITYLIDLLKSQDVFNRQSAVFAFDELTEQIEIPDSIKPAIPILRNLLSDPDEVVREMAEEVLEQIENRRKKAKP